MKTSIDQLHQLIYYNLVLNSPVLSGNMQMFIQQGFSGEYQSEIYVKAPFYDMTQWKKTGTIVHTGAVKNGFTDYAFWVNEAGGFGTHNDSEKWINRVLNMCAEEFARKIGGKVEKYLDE